MSYMILNVLYSRKKKELTFPVTLSFDSLDLVPHNLERASGAQHGKGGNYRQGSQKEYHDNVKEGRWISTQPITTLRLYGIYPDSRKPYSFSRKNLSPGGSEDKIHYHYRGILEMEDSPLLL